jgi:hypothetical protein
LFWTALLAIAYLAGVMIDADSERGFGRLQVLLVDQHGMDAPS